MSLVQAKCTNCGASIEVDPQMEAGICPYCNTAYITQKAIVNYNTTIVNHNTIHADTVNIVGGDYENFIKVARECWAGHDFEGAYQNFTKALEMKPDSEEAALYRSLCLGWKERETNYKIILNTYHKVFDKIDFETADDEQVEMFNYFLNELDNLNFATVDSKFKLYNPDYYDTTIIECVWQAIENGIYVQLKILDFSEKIKDKNSDCTSNYVNYMMRLLNYYQTICMKWQHIMPIDHRYHSSVYHPKKEVYEQRIVELAEKIKIYQPDFTVNVKKRKANLIQKYFIGSCVLTGVSFILSFIPLGLAGTLITALLGIAALVLNIIILARFKNIDKRIMIATIILLIITAYIAISSVLSLVFYIQYGF